MKRSLIFVMALMLAAVAPLGTARGQSGGGDDLPIDFMYDALSPDGDWIYTPNYGYVWQPLVSQQPGWAPYTDGSWAFTDAGWTWISNEDFGWLTYHYGRWIRLMHRWMWVPGNVWAPAWVSWRQTQGQIGWAPLPPEAMWSPNVGFGGWTDSYYDVGPAYYNFVPVNQFTNSGSLRPYIMDRSRNFTFYDQSVNVTHTVYQPNVMNHIYVGGPDPQRINGLGGNPVRRLTLRHDEENFRRNWLERNGGGPPRGAGALSRIEQGQLFVAAPSFRRGDSQALPGRVRESLQQAEADRGWHGIADAQAAQRLREKQREELARTSPANLPEKRVLPATSTVPPPATGRVLDAEERRGRPGPGGPPATVPPTAETRPQGGDERRPMTPKNPLPSGGPPGVPPRTPETPPGAGTTRVPEVERPRGNRPDQNGGGERGRDNAPERGKGRDRDMSPPGQRPGFTPGQPQGGPRPGMQPGERPDTPRVQPPQGGQRPDGAPGQRPDFPPGQRPGIEPGQRPTVPPGREPGESPRQRPFGGGGGMPPGHRPGQEPGNAQPPQPQRPPNAPPSPPVAPPRAAPSPAPMPNPPRPQPPQVQPPPQPGAVPHMQPQAPGGQPHGSGGPPHGPGGPPRGPGR